jgi:hypothetical protein
MNLSIKIWSLWVAIAVDLFQGASIQAQTSEIFIDYFRSSETAIESQRAVRLSWKVRFASRVDIYDSILQVVYSNLMHEDSLEVFPERTTRYILTASSEDGRSTSQIITIFVSGPRILQFGASTYTIFSKQPVRLWWKIISGKKVDIFEPIKNVTYTDLGNENFIEVWPEVTTTYYLNIYGFDGSFMSQNLTVFVNLIPLRN